MANLMALADDPFVQITIIDGHFRRVAKGTGSLECVVEPGLYTVKFKAGLSFTDEIVTIEPNSAPVTVRSPTLTFSSAAPLSDTTSIGAAHISPAVEISTSQGLPVGSGSQLFVMVRDPQMGGPPNPSAGVSVRDGTGRLMVDLSKEGPRDRERSWAACNIDMDPGHYRLRVTSGRDRYEMTIICAAGWQTQVFLGQTKSGSAQSQLRADLSTAAVFMARVGRGFDPTGSRSTDIARQALNNRTSTVAPADLEDMGIGKFENPMLGIYAAHLLIRERKPRRDLVNAILANTETLVGPHPDLLAVAAWLDGTVRRTARFAVPPMMLDSYRLILEKGLSHRDIVPVDSMFASIIDGIRATGSWLVWRAPSDTTQPSKAVTPRGASRGETRSIAVQQPSDLTELEAALFRRMQIGRREGSRARPRGISNLEEASLGDFRISEEVVPHMPAASLRPGRSRSLRPASRGNPSSAARKTKLTRVGGAGGAAESTSFKDAAIEFGVPFAAVEMAARRLEQKLDRMNS